MRLKDMGYGPLQDIGSAVLAWVEVAGVTYAVTGLTCLAFIEFFSE